MIKAMYVNLPVRDVHRSREFWTQLGFSFNETFSDEKAPCLILREGSLYSMLISREFFTTFTHRAVADGSTTQVLLALEVESRDKVDELVQKALDHSGSRYRESADHGWMYYDSFADPDGHQWEILFTDETKLITT